MRRSSSTRLVAATWLALLAPGCQCQPKALPSEPCVDKSKPELDKCKGGEEKAQEEIISLKKQLAQALANPGTFKVDPSVLMIDGKPIEVKVQEGSIGQEQIVETMRTNKAVLKGCYERAMKSNFSLQRQTITLSIGFKVKPTGIPSEIAIKPNYDNAMIDCMKKAIMRWRFPSFTGQPVEVESPLTLTPKK
jgi:hypothetical protein